MHGIVGQASITRIPFKQVIVLLTVVTLHIKLKYLDIGSYM